MNDSPESDTSGEDGSDQPDRRLSNRVGVQGYDFLTEIGDFTVVDLSLGGMRLMYPEGNVPVVVGQSIAGDLDGSAAKPIWLTAEVVWINPEYRHFGCTFQVLGKNIASELLEILL